MKCLALASLSAYHTSVSNVAALPKHAPIVRRKLYQEIVEKGLPDQVFLTRNPREREVAGL